MAAQPRLALKALASATVAASALLLAAGCAPQRQTPDVDAVRLGVLLGFTGPIESLTPAMAASADMAIEEVNASGLLLGGVPVEALRADSTCIDNAAATTAAERLVSEGVNGIVGADCSGVTKAVLTNVALPNSVAMISPSATSPTLSTVEDNGLFFRTAPSDTRQGQIMSDVILDRGIRKVAVTYTNNDYGQGLNDSFVAAYEAAGGEITIAASHEDGRGDYTAEVAALGGTDAEVLVVIGYADQGGAGIIRSALDTGAFDTFALVDGMISESLTEKFGADINGSFGQLPGSSSEGATIFEEMATAKGVDGTSGFTKESYDAAALMLLAMQAANSATPADYIQKVEAVANAPGELIQPGELGKALDILASGGDVDYDGASSVELIGPGESAGNYREIEIVDSKIETVKYR